MLKSRQAHHFYADETEQSKITTNPIAFFVLSTIDPTSPYRRRLLAVLVSKRQFVEIDKQGNSISTPALRASRDEEEVWR